MIRQLRMKGGIGVVHAEIDRRVEDNRHGDEELDKEHLSKLKQIDMEMKKLDKEHLPTFKHA
jgi:hypothetical protein